MEDCIPSNNIFHSLSVFVAQLEIFARFCDISGYRLLAVQKYSCVMHLETERKREERGKATVLCTAVGPRSYQLTVVWFLPPRSLVLMLLPCMFVSHGAASSLWNSLFPGWSILELVLGVAYCFLCRCLGSLNAGLLIGSFGAVMI